MTSEISVAIIGLGSRGLSVLERILTIAEKLEPAGVRVEVEVVDPTCAGTGLHRTEQPDYLLLNTVCGQVTMFPDRATVGADAERIGPNLHDWVSARHLRLDPNGWTVGSTGRSIRPTDFLPRRILGEYLRWFRDELLRHAPHNTRITLHRAEAVAVITDVDEKLVFRLDGGETVRTRYAFLTVGHTPNIDSVRSARIIDRPYPLPDRLYGIEPKQSVAVGGMGLSAMDILAALTVGRGGQFTERNGERQYLPSGREPFLLLYSQSGVPYRARPLVNQPVPGYFPVLLTPANIDQLRTLRRGPLDFDVDLLPLVLAEMRIAYHWRRAEVVDDCDVHDLLAAVSGIAEATTLLDELDKRFGRFDAFAAWDGSIGMVMDDSRAYQEWVIETVQRDLAEGVVGFERSPVKAALDVLRELRDTIRYAVDFGGLTPDSLDEFIARAVPRMNRAVVGPQHERHLDLLALVQARVVELPFGPSPSIAWHPDSQRWTISSTRLSAPYAREVDWLCSARVPLPAVESSASPLIDNLYRSGRLRRYRQASRHVLGVDVDRDLHPIDVNGRSDHRIWVLGPLCEGATFYNHLVPSPRTYSRPMSDANRCVAALFSNDRILTRSASRKQAS